MNETEAGRRYLVPVLKARFPDIYLEKIPGSPFKKGMIDYIFCLDGKGGIIELKMFDNREPTPLQRKHLTDITKAGGIGLLIIIEQNRSLTCQILKPSKVILKITQALAATVENLS